MSAPAPQWRESRRLGAANRASSHAARRSVPAGLSESPPRARNTKHQTPSSREVPNLKHQTSKTDAGANGAQVGFSPWNLLPGLSASQTLRCAPQTAEHPQVVGGNAGFSLLRRLEGKVAE